ncbi:hypothetical protein N7510_010942 [Penicillium lagena]|uniref:uncharacterized protein n=1 Tax=Penicillium lagena TaxID=94218 RepID=UPI0025420842|nr:uncharacterized protein N7510_010942 [Penicillium lagena]KAJ5601408.1 hypothetical protein N7510_010942 [Penicillium lagena]
MLSFSPSPSFIHHILHLTSLLFSHIHSQTSTSWVRPSSSPASLCVTLKDRIGEVNQNSQQAQARDFTPADLGFTPIRLSDCAPGNPVPQHRHSEHISMSLIDAIHRLASDPDLRSHVPPSYDPALYQSPINEDDDDDLIHLPSEDIIAIARRVEEALYQSPINIVDY